MVLTFCLNRKISETLTSTDMMKENFKCIKYLEFVLKKLSKKKTQIPCSLNNKLSKDLRNIKILKVRKLKDTFTLFYEAIITCIPNLDKVITRKQNFTPVFLINICV